MLRLCEASVVAEGLPLRVERPGWRPLAVFRCGDEVHVTDATCTHGNASLTEGSQHLHKVQCPLHGGVFDIRSGAVLAPPCTRPLKTYLACIDAGFITMTDKPT